MRNKRRQEELLPDWATCLLHARTLDLSLEFIGVYETYTDAAHGYLDWIGKHGFKEVDIWYANLFDTDSGKLTCKFIIQDGSIEVVPARPNVLNTSHSPRIIEIIRKKVRHNDAR